MSTTRDSEILKVINNLENIQFTKLDELDQKLEKVASSVKTLKIIHTRINLSFDRIEPKFKKMPGEVRKINQYLAGVNEQIGKLDKTKKKSTNPYPQLLTSKMGFLLTIAMAILFSLGQIVLQNKLK